MRPAPTAAAPPPAHPEPVRLDATRFVRSFVDGDQLFVVDRAGGAVAGDTLAAYRLPSGERQWRIPVPVDPLGLRRGQFGHRFAGDSLLISSLDSTGVVRTVAVGTGDGRLRWRADGQVIGVSTDGAVVLRGMDAVVGTGQSPEAGDGLWLRAVEADSGQPRWYAPAAGGFDVVRWVDGRLAQVIQVDPQRQVRVLDAATGRAVAAGALPARLAPEYGWAAHDLLVLTAGGSVTAVELDGLAARWSVLAPRVSYVIACGALICLNDAEQGMWALDPADGATRWAHGDRYAVESSGPYLLTAPGRDEPSSHRIVVDPATGEQVAPGSGRWSVLAVDADGWLAQWSDPGAAEAWVARITADGSTPRVLLHLREGVAACQAGPAAVVCRRADGSLGIWALPD
ncbi:hypothetical protein [Micromonospora sp. LOL_023]|uniref:hypothetical protein n=1 Tax=Micromonospora sp. LOL_023 TaxID=3345418 RepID=UPI003A83A9A2